MEVKIIVKTEVQCPQFSVRILLSLCRCCPYYRYETVDGFVICGWVGKKDDRNFKDGKGNG